MRDVTLNFVSNRIENIIIELQQYRRHCERTNHSARRSSSMTNHENGISTRIRVNRRHDTIRCQLSDTEFIEKHYAREIICLQMQFMISLSELNMGTRSSSLLLNDFSAIIGWI